MEKTYFKIIISGIVLMLIFSPCYSREEFIKISKNVNVRLGPSTQSSVLVKAKRGDIFKFVSEKGSWIEVYLFSGESRFIHKNFAVKVEYFPALPSNAQLMYRKFGIIEDRAMENAREKYPSNLMKQIDYQRILIDKYKLDLCHRHNVQPPTHPLITLTGAKKNW